MYLADGPSPIFSSERIAGSGWVTRRRGQRMKQSRQRVKRHIISMRISAEEWDSLHEAMKCLKVRRVSDLMREVFKQVLTPRSPYETGMTEGQERDA
jgi:hypothetical protein